LLVSAAPAAVVLPGSTLEKPVQHGEARLGPSQRVARFVGSLRPCRELLSRDVASERQDLELTTQPGLVTGMEHGAGRPTLRPEDREPRLGATAAAAPL
jgi:hypothetical protein